MLCNNILYITKQELYFKKNKPELSILYWFSYSDVQYITIYKYN